MPEPIENLPAMPTNPRARPTRVWFALLGLLFFFAGIIAVVWLWPRPVSVMTTYDGPLLFDDISERAGVRFAHFDSATDMHYIQEIMGSGVAWIDYDEDGWLDLICVQDSPIFPEKHTGTLPTHKLFRNNGDGTFTDVTIQVGLAHSCYGMGVVVGDLDNDGFDDLVISYIGGVKLYHNQPHPQGGRRFVDGTSASLDNPHWATSLALGDIDGDGLLDLYVCNYVVLDMPNYKPCTDTRTGLRNSCPPMVFENTTHRLFKNLGGMKFQDISQESGIAKAPAAPGLAVSILDLNGDGRPDIFVANDLKPTYLFHNQGGGKFVERSVMSGCGLDANGRFIAGMAVAAGDLDGTGRPSLYVTNFQNEPNILFLNRGNMQFQEWSHPSGLGAPSMARLSFGAVLLDADLDGKLDVAVANGHVYRNSKHTHGADYEQQAQLFLGTGGGRFRDVSDGAGAYFHRKLVGRGLAVADFDNDGKPDLVFSHNGGPAVLLRNVTRNENAWLSLELVGNAKKSNRNAIGAVVEVESGGKRQSHWVQAGGSYLSSSDRRILAGLATAERADLVRVTWPSGLKQEFRNLTARARYRLREGVESAERR